VLRFDLNVSILFREYPFLERFDHAARNGFGAVEFWWPAGEDPATVGRRVRDAGLEVVLINLDAGDMAAGDRGLLNDPSRRERLRENVPVAIELAQQLGCRRLNALAGHWRPDQDREAQLAYVRETVAWIAAQAEAAGITVMIEAVNRLENGPYLFTNTRDTLGFISSVGAANVEYQYDIYHMQRMEGNIASTLRERIDRIGHIQVADSPGRNQPGTGELNFRYLLATIDELGYDGYVGLEYTPMGRSEESLAWLPADRTGPLRVEALRL
jgi:hydroxypyruvate isomerase